MIRKKNLKTLLALLFVSGMISCTSAERVTKKAIQNPVKEEKMIIFDGHADIFSDVTRRTLEGETDIIRKHHLERLKNGSVRGAVFIAWTPELDYYGKLVTNPTEYFKKMVNIIEEELKRTSDIVYVMKTKEDVVRAFENEDILYIIKGVEGIRIENEKLEVINELYSKGYRLISLTWNEENILATGARGNPQRGLTETGIKALKKIQEFGIVVDVSHLNEKSFWDVLSNTEGPIIASHSNVHKLMPHVRNLSDEQIRAIAKRNGVIGINAYRGFIDSKSENRNLEHYINHIEYVISLVGIDHVGLGFDFCEYLYNDDEIVNPNGLKDASESYKVLEELEKRGYSKEQIEAIAYGNFMRVYREVLK